MFHAITGCDTVSAFVGHGKKSAWATWNTLPELTDALLSLAKAPTSIQEDTMHVIERFVILLYDRTSKCKDVNKARKKLFAKKSSVQNIPPITLLWSSSEEICPSGWSCLGPGIGTRARAPSPQQTGAGIGVMMGPTHHSGPHSPRHKTCYELVSWDARKGCRNRCKCKKASLQCTGLCFCEGECQ
ncbi:hypothetical protein GWK47_053675 [Chionoecetes opilio]|uniref:Tesmin/TSO1-like CXC domain-containing protein n=1 Tax=Chionoecetes opilio TaxID=41210 RepID=A0A8J4Y5U2_CHIOP|nr:hypothetical protein GWK47_053675 [Chionoecetes opilio]